MDPFQTRAPHQCIGAQGSNTGPQSLGYSITGPSGFDCYRHNHCCSLHQQTRGTHSHHLLWLVVDLFLWLQSQDITLRARPKCDSRPLVSAEPAHHDRVESPPPSRESDIQTVWNSSRGQLCHSPQHTSSPVHGPSSGASSTGDRCFVTGLAGEVNVHVSTVSPAQKSHSEAQDHPDRQGDIHRPWWPSQPWFPHLLRLSVDHLLRFFQYCRDCRVLQRPVTTGRHLQRQVTPSAPMEALMQHYKVARFSREVS